MEPRENMALTHWERKRFPPGRSRGWQQKPGRADFFLRKLSEGGGVWMDTWKLITEKSAAPQESLVNTSMTLFVCRQARTDDI